MLNKKIKLFIYLAQFIIITTFLSYVFIKSDETTSTSRIEIVFNKTLNYIDPSLAKKQTHQVKPKRLFCFILTSSKNFLGGKAKIIFDTWASKCDNYKFVSVIPEEIKDERFYKENGTEFDYGFDILQPPGLGVTVNDTYKKVCLNLKILWIMSKMNRIYFLQAN